MPFLDSPPPLLDRYGLCGRGGAPSTVVTAYGADAARLVDGAVVRFRDFRLQGSPERTVMCRRVERPREDLAVADVLPVLGVVTNGGDVVDAAPATGW